MKTIMIIFWKNKYFVISSLWLAQFFITSTVVAEPGQSFMYKPKQFHFVADFSAAKQKHHKTSTNILLVRCWDIPSTNG